MDDYHTIRSALADFRRIYVATNDEWTRNYVTRLERRLADIKAQRKPQHAHPPIAHSNTYRGVYYDAHPGRGENAKRWRAHIRINGKVTLIGYYATDIDAAHAYDRVALTVRGRKAMLNFPADVMPTQEVLL